MDLVQLRQLLAIAERSNLSHAAEALHITQPGLSKSMQRLTREIGAPIYVRRGRGIELTECGRTLLRHAKLVHAQLQEAQAEVAAFAGGELGHIRVGAGPAWLSHYLPLAISRILRARPGIRFSVETGFPEELTRSLRQGDLDLVLAGLPEEPHDPDIQCIRLADDVLCVIGREGHPLARKRNRSLADYVSYPWILPGPGVVVRQRLEQVFLNHRTTPPVPAIEANALSFILSTVRVSDCLGVATSQALKQEGAQGIVRIDLAALSLKRDAGIIYRRPGEISTAARGLIAELRRIAARFGHV